MSESTTLDAARENAEAVSRLIEQYLGQARSEKNVRDVVKFARLLCVILGDVWGQFQARLDQGLEASRVREAAASASRACESVLRVIGQLEGMQSTRAGERLQDLSELLVAVPHVNAIQKAARELLDRLNASEPSIDEARLAEGLAAVAGGACENTSAMVERLRAGGEL